MKFIKINKNRHLHKYNKFSNSFFYWNTKFNKINNKYFFTKKRIKFKKLYNKKNLILDNFQKFINLFLTKGKKQQLSSKMSLSISNLYDIFFNPEEYYDLLPPKYENYENYLNLKKLFLFNFNYFKFKNFYPLLLENYKLIFDFEKNKKNKKNKKIKNKSNEFKYIQKNKRLNYLIPFIRSQVYLEKFNNFQDRFFVFFSNLCIFGINETLLIKKYTIYGKLLQSKKKK